MSASLRVKLACAALFIAAYSLSLAYFYHRNADSITRSKVAALQTGPVLNLAQTKEANGYSFDVPASELSKASDSAQPTTVSDYIPARSRHVDQAVAQSISSDATTPPDDLSGIIALMSDPDPEVARVARAMYDAHARGE